MGKLIVRIVVLLILFSIGYSIYTSCSDSGGSYGPDYSETYYSEQYYSNAYSNKYNQNLGPTGSGGGTDSGTGGGTGSGESTTVEGKWESVPSVSNTKVYIIDGHAYAYYAGNLSWDNARLACERYGGHLMTVTSEREQTILKQVIGSKYAWLGASDAKTEGTWEWVTGEAFTYTNWNSGEPNNSGNEDYLMTYSAACGWNDTAGVTSDIAGYVCEWEDLSDLRAAEGTWEYIDAFGVEVYTVGEHSYAYFPWKVYWDVAVSKCEANGGHLMTVTSAVEQRILQTVANGHFVWLGASDTETEGTWKWVTGEAFTYTNWNSGEPNNSSSKEHYLGTNQTDGGWNDFTIDSAIGSNKIQGYICEWDTQKALTDAIAGSSTESTVEKEGFQYIAALDKEVYIYGGHAYLYFEENLKWTDANLKCQSMGGHLVTVTSGAEQAVINKLLNGKLTLLGATDVETEGLWKWITGEPFFYENWDAGQPDNSSNEDYLQTYTKEGTWNDRGVGSSSGLGYICEWETIDAAERAVPNYQYGVKTVASVDDLRALEGSYGIHVLTEDIDLSGIEWTPITNFYGILVGNGHVISNLTITSLGGTHIGFFKLLTGTVDSVIFHHVTVRSSTATGYVGAIAGVNKGTVTGCIVTGTVEAPSAKYVGGLVGTQEASGVMRDCDNFAAVTGGSVDVGGVVGNFRGEGMHLYNAGSVTGVGSIGGVCGYVNGNLTDAVNDGAVNGKEAVGGVVGYADKATMTSLKNHGTVIGTGSYTGGILGRIHNSEVIIDGAENDGAVNGTNYVGGVLGYGTGTSSHLKNHATVTGIAIVGGIVGATTNHKSLTHAENTGNVIATGTVNWDSRGDHSYVGGIAGRVDGHIADCENSGNVTGFDGRVGGIAGYVHNNGTYTLENLKNSGNIEGADVEIGGIIGDWEAPNVTLKNAENTGNVNGTLYVGGLVGWGNGTGVSLRNSGSVNGVAKVGGIFGATWNHKSLIDLKNSGDITATGTTNWDKHGTYSYVGGIAGRIAGPLSNAENTGNVTAFDGRAGGIIGHVHTDNVTYAMEQLKNSGTVTGGGEGVGGIAGSISHSRVTVNHAENLSTGAVSGKGSVGGIVGVYAITAAAKLSNAVNHASVTATEQKAGGLVGALSGTYALTLTDCENAGAVSAAAYVGGLYGYNTTATVTVVRTVDTGSVGTVVDTLTLSFAEEKRITEDGYWGVKNSFGDSLDLSPLSAYMTGDYVFQFNVVCNLSEVDDGYQEIYLYSQNVTGDLNKTEAYMKEHYGLIIGNKLNHGALETAPYDFLLLWEVAGDACVPEMYVRYDAQGDGADTWLLHGLTVTVSVLQKA